MPSLYQNGMIRSTFEARSSTLRGSWVWPLSVAEVEAEGVPGRIEQDAHVGLWLAVRDRGAHGDGVLDGLVQVVHLDVEVHHHLLLALGRRPHRAFVLR